MAINWTITPPGGGGPVSLESLNLILVGGTFVSRGVDVMRLRMTEDFDKASGLYAYKESVTLYRDGVRFFEGICIRTPRMAESATEAVDFLIGGPWFHLANMIYEQDWALGSGSILDARVVLQKDPAGPNRTTMEEVSAILQYAIDQGAPFQVGSLSAGFHTFPTEARNITCEEAVNKMLRFHPQVVSWFDYSTNPPTLNMVNRSALTSRALTIGTDNIDPINIRSRDDLLPDGVRIIYETVSNIDGEIYRAIQEDIAGSQRGLSVLNAFVELEGLQMQTQKQRVEVEKIPVEDEDEQTEEAQDFVLRHEPALKAFDKEDWEVSKIKTEFAKDEDKDPDKQPKPINPEATRLSVADVTDVPNELVEGALEDWMRVKERPVICKLTVRYKADIATDPMEVEELKFFGVDGQKELEIAVQATDAVTKLYKGVTQWIAPEEAPAGLAASIKAELEPLQWEGALVLTDEDVSGTRYIGTKLNLNGGLPAWASMDAVIQSVDFDVQTGSLTLSFGPVDVLGPADMIELMRSIRANKETWWSDEERASNRASAEDSAGSKGDTVTPYNDPKSMSAGGKGQRAPHSPLTPFQASLDADTPELKLTLNPAKFWERNVTLHNIIAPGGGNLTDSPRPVLTIDSTGTTALWIYYDLNGTEGSNYGKIFGNVTLSVGPPPGTPDVALHVANVTLTAAVGDEPAKWTFEPILPFLSHQRRGIDYTLTITDCDDAQLEVFEWSDGLLVRAEENEDGGSLTIKVDYCGETEVPGP